MIKHVNMCLKGLFWCDGLRLRKVKVVSIVGISSSLLTLLLGPSLRISDIGRARSLHKKTWASQCDKIDQIIARDPMTGHWPVRVPSIFVGCYRIQDQMKIAICLLSITYYRVMNPLLIEGYAEQATRKAVKARVGNESDVINNVLQN